jgi:hypothetical protein
MRTSHHYYNSSRGVSDGGPEDFRKNAKECMRLAEMASDPDSKIILMNIAQTWIRLAEVNESFPERRFCSTV